VLVPVEGRLVSGVLVLDVAVAGVLVAVLVAKVSTMDGRPERSLFNTVSPNEVRKYKAAVPTVSLLKKVAAPCPPKMVWEDPPKAAPISAPFPVCNKTTPIKTRQIRT
jgi:hypothetical protein